MTEHMRKLIISLRVVLTMLGFNLGLAFALFMFNDMVGTTVVLFSTFVCACSWYAVERQIKRERNDTY